MDLRPVDARRPYARPYGRMSLIDAIDNTLLQVQRHEMAVRLLVGWCVILTASVIILIARGRRK